MKTNKLVSIVTASLLVLVSMTANAALKPFVLASMESGSKADVVTATKKKLTDGGFKVVGEYSPYDSVTIIGVTNDALIETAAKTKFGAFGAVQRVTVTKGKDGAIQVGFTNPVYYGNAYRMKGDLSGVADQLAKALGKQKDYGSEKGKTADQLSDYQYKWLMPYFTDRLVLAEYGSHSMAVKGVEEALAAGKGAVTKVYRVDIPGKDTTVFGVHMKGADEDDCSGDKYIMDRIDFKDVKSSGHLPYEIVVAGKSAYALRAEFRIAISFPDLSMMGSNSFASIMCAPSAIEEALTKGAGGEVEF
ncbi:MAG: hypothetical protein P8Y24_10770 [Gammaproteobacteria bacterium]|jgi:hypothetical protein